MAKTTDFSHVTPPLVIDVQARIKLLRGYLDPSNSDYQPEQQHLNIRTAIQLYEEGKIDGVQHVYIREGKIVTLEDIHCNTGKGWTWVEGVFYQLARKVAYGHGPFSTNNHEEATEQHMA